MTTSVGLVVAHAAATLLLVGLIWTVQVVLYPLFRVVEPDGWASYHEAHVRRITWVVAPLMLVEAASGVWLALQVPRAVSPALAWTGVALLAVVWLSTAFVQVPLHDRLARGLDVEIVDRLVTTNWARTLAWSARGGVVLAMLWLVARSTAPSVAPTPLG